MFFDNKIISADQLYTYDALYRLIKAEGREQQGLADFGGQDNYDDSAWQSGHKGNGDITHRYIQHYLYDAVGNIMQLRHIVPSNTAYSYTRNYGYSSGSNRLDSTEVTGAVTTPYAYVHDTRGNMTELPHLDTIYWNVRNELHKIEQGTMAAYYQYGGGQRIRKYVVKGNIAEERIYLGSFKLYRKFDSGSLTIERHTVHNLSRTCGISDDTGRIAMLEKRTIGDRLDDHDTEEVLVRYIYSNHLQSASLELDQHAAIISYEEYHPYGTTSFQSHDATVHANAKRYRYTGKERDEESGLYYHGARYYIPWLGRWTACDPLESKYAGMSPYNYGNCNPITYNDPSGMSGDDTVNVQYGSQTYTVQANYYPSGGGLKETSEFGYRWQEDGQTVVNYHDDKTDKNYSVLEQNAPGSFDGKNLYSWVNIDTGQAEAFTGDKKSFKNHRWLQFHSDAEKDALAKAAAEEKAKEEALHTLRTAASWTPWVGGALDIGEGLYKGDWKQVAGGAGSLALDFFGGKIIKAGVLGLKGIIKAGAKEGAEIALHETTQAVSKTGWLQFHEGVGHTISRHVGKTDAELISRLSSSSRITGASTFASQEVAESVISSTIKTNRPALNAWLRSGSTRNLVLDFTGNDIIGRGIMRGQSAVSDLTKARVVLKPNGSGGYNILTAFTK